MTNFLFVTLMLSAVPIFVGGIAMYRKRDNKTWLRLLGVVMLGASLVLWLLLPLLSRHPVTVWM